LEKFELTTIQLTRVMYAVGERISARVRVRRVPR